MSQRKLCLNCKYDDGRPKFLDPCNSCNRSGEVVGGMDFYDMVDPQPWLDEHDPEAKNTCITCIHGTKEGHEEPCRDCGHRGQEFWEPLAEEPVCENYTMLSHVLDEAFSQAANGKGKVRHAVNEPFQDQKICVITRWLKDSPVGGPLFQAVKKCLESSRLEPDAAIHELLGAINYIAAAVIVLRELKND